MKIIESFTGFQPLEEVWIGGTYPTNFYNHLSAEVQDTFGKITEQTEVGFNKLEKTLVDLNVKVRKPRFTQNIDDYMDQFGNLIKPPVAPRDWTIVLGNELWTIPQGYKVEPYADVLEEYKQNGEHVEILDRGKDPRAWLEFPNIVRIGNRVIIDVQDVADDAQRKENVYKAIDTLKKDYEIVLTDEGGHSDGVFCPIKLGQIFSSHWASDKLYDTLPGWEVYWISNKNNYHWNGKWWTKENNFYSPVFSQHIEEKASEWVGDSRETVFPVNMLVVDEQNVICLTEDEGSFKRMEEIGITPHVVDFRAGHFWDGGIHCITCDIRRSGGKKEYFKK